MVVVDRPHSSCGKKPCTARGEHLRRDQNRFKHHQNNLNHFNMTSTTAKITSTTSKMSSTTPNKYDYNHPIMTSTTSKCAFPRHELNHSQTELSHLQKMTSNTSKQVPNRLQTCPQPRRVLDRLQTCPQPRTQQMTFCVVEVVILGGWLDWPTADKETIFPKTSLEHQETKDCNKVRGPQNATC